ncbi:MAG: Gfo/Idh/MocA family oxidoreductase [Planctomycetia bacterium]|nr:Gfo/Idh/MocA family oxidoreductase [Planctomycetia bacterium]
MTKQTTRSNRRTFLKQGMALAGASFIPSFLPPRTRAAHELPPSDRLRLAFIGVGNMGRPDAVQFTSLLDVAAICDVDSDYGLARTLATKRVGIHRGDELIPPDTYKHYQEILDRDDIDIVGIATPDHWHVKIAIEALMAGKHVFCQKPLTLTLEENQLIRTACEKYHQQVFQVGTQQRSMKGLFATAALMVRKGMLGTIRRVVCDVTGNPLISGPIPEAKVPQSLDWELWSGQTPIFPYRATEEMKNGRPLMARGNFFFRYFYEYAGGNITDWGAHHVDAALWALDRQAPDSGPVSIDGSKSILPVPFKDGYPQVSNEYNVSNEFNVVAKFADGLELNLVNHSDATNGILFEGDQGRIHVNRGRIKGKPYEDKLHESLTESDFEELYKGKPFESHKENFIRVIREGGVPVSDVFSNLPSVEICHLSNISIRLQRPITWDPVAKQITGDEQAASFQSRERRQGYDIPQV